MSPLLDISDLSVTFRTDRGTVQAVDSVSLHVDPGETLAVVGPRQEIATALERRLAGIADAVSLTNNRAPDPELWADVVGELREDPRS